MDRAPWCFFNCVNFTKEQKDKKNSSLSVSFGLPENWYALLCNPNGIRHFISTGLGNLLSKDARNLNTFSYFRLNFDNNQVQPSLNIFLLYSIVILKRNFLTISLNLCKKKKAKSSRFLIFHQIQFLLRKIFIFESTINHFQSNNLYR